MDVSEIQEKIIASILGTVEQQEVATVVNKPVAEEQNVVSQVLQGQLNNPSFDRIELRELRKFLKQPLVGAAVQQLRKALQTYSSSNDALILIEAVRELCQSQGERSSNESVEKKPGYRISRDNLKLVCYEYVYT